MKTKRCFVLALLFTMLILVSACGSKEKGGKRYYGTWKATQAEVEGSIFTVEELEAVGDNSISDSYIIIKEGGKAYLRDPYDSELTDWTIEEGGINIAGQHLEYKNRTLALILDDNKIIFEKVSPSQALTKSEAKSDDMEKKTEKAASSKTGKKTDASDAEKETAKSEKPQKDKDEETKTEEVKKEEAESDGIEISEAETESSEGSSRETSEKQDETGDNSEFASIVSDGNEMILGIEAEIRTEWEALKASITTYDSFVQNEEAIDAFYEMVQDRHSDICTVAYQTALDYAKAILASDVASGAKYDMAGELENDVYDDMFDDIEDLIYEGLFDDIEDYFYDGILKDDDDAGVPYGDWYDTRSDEYSRWYDCRSDVYSEWYDSRSEVYSLKFDLAGELWSSDETGAQKTIDRFEKKVNKRLGVQ